MWSKDVASRKAVIDIAERDRKASEVKPSYFSRMWGSSKSKEQTEEEKKEAEEQEVA